MKYIKNKYIKLSILSLSAFTLSNFAYAQAANPIIMATSTATSSSIYINLPVSFNGKFITNCHNEICNSTTTSITDQDIKDIQNRIQKEEKAMQDFWNEQQKFFNQMFENFSNFNF